jgi:hypothetical protein
MKKVCFVLLALVMLGGFFITTAEAGQLCWQVDSTNDSFDGYVNMVVSGGKVSRSVHGVLYSTVGLYLPVAGNMAKYPDGSKWFMQLSTTAFDGYIGMGLTLNASDLSGTGGMITITDTRNVFSLTFTNISCKVLPPYVPPTE